MAKSGFDLQYTLAGAPTTVRAQAALIATDASGKFFAYPSGTIVIVRNVEDPSSVLVCTRHSVPVTVARLSQNGQLIASGDQSGNVIVWANRADTLEKLNSKQLNGPVRDIAWSDDLERLIIVGEGKGSFGAAITLSGNTIGSITGHSQAIISCDLRKSRPYRAFGGGMDSLVSCFEGPPFKFARSVQGHKGNVNCVRFSPDGSLVATVSASNEIILVNGTSGEKERALTTDHQGSVYCAAWSPDGNKIATASADKTIKVTDVNSGKVLQSVSFGKGVPAMQQGVFYSTRGVVSVALSGDLSFIGEDGSVKQVWRGHTKHVLGLYFDGAGRDLVSVGADGKVLAWKNGSPETRTVEHGAGDTFSACARVASSGEVLAVGGSDLVSFDVANGTAKSVTSEANGALGVARLDSGFIVLVHRSSFTVLDTAGTKVHEEKLPQFDAASLASHGNAFAIGGDKEVRVYKLSGKAVDRVSTFSGSHKGSVTALAFSGNGASIASGDGTRLIFVWNTADAKVLHDELVFHSMRVTALAFDAAGGTLLSGSVDSSVIVWDLANKKHVIHNNAHRGGVSAVAFGGEGSAFTAGGDNCIRRWKV